MNLFLTEATRTHLLAHYAAYPLLKAEDIFKFLYQSALGCEHMVSSLSAAVAYIQTEAASLPSYSGGLTEALDGDYSRVHLAALRQGMSPETLGRLFYLSAQQKTDGIGKLEEKLLVAEELVRQGILPLPSDEFSQAAQHWKDLRYPAIHHSSAFREAYHPAYRVIHNSYIPRLPLLSAIDQALSEQGTVCLEMVGDFEHIAALSSQLRELYVVSETEDRLASAMLTYDCIEEALRSTAGADRPCRRYLLQNK